MTLPTSYISKRTPRKIIPARELVKGATILARTGDCIEVESLSISRKTVKINGQDIPGDVCVEVFTA